MDYQLDNIRKLKKQLSASQIEHLDRVWNYYLEHAEWPTSPEYHRGYGKKEKTIEVLESIGGNIVFEVDRNPLSEYHLTLLGLFLLSNGEAKYQILVRYYRYLKELFQTQGWQKRISSEQLRVDIGFDDIEIQQLFDMIHAFYQLPTAGYSGKPPEFNPEMPRDIDDLLDSDIENFILSRTFKEYTDGKPVTLKHQYDKGMKYVSVSQRDLELYEAGLAVIDEYRKAIHILSTIIALIVSMIILIAPIICILSAFFPTSIPFPFNESSSSFIQKVIGSVSAIFGYSLIVGFKLSYKKLLNYFDTKILRFTEKDHINDVLKKYNIEECVSIENEEV